MLHRFATWIGQVLPSSALPGKGQVDYVPDSLTDRIPATDKADHVWVERRDPASRTGWVSLR